MAASGGRNCSERTAETGAYRRREQHISEVSEQCERIPDEPEEAVTSDFEEEYEEEENMGFSMSM